MILTGRLPELQVIVFLKRPLTRYSRSISDPDRERERHVYRSPPRTTTRRRARGRRSRFSHLYSIIFDYQNYQICLMKRIEGDYADHNHAGSAQPRSLLNGQRLLESSLSKCSNFVSSSFGCLFVGGLKINMTTTILFFLFFFAYQLTFQCQLFH